MTAQTQQRHGHMLVFEGEASTLLETIRFTCTKWRDCERVWFTLVASLKDKHHGTSEFFVIVSNIIYKVALHSNFKVKFIRRKINMITHTLAKTTYSYASHHIFEISPICIVHLLINNISKVYQANGNYSIYPRPYDILTNKLLYFIGRFTISYNLNVCLLPKTFGWDSKSFQLN